jgi:lipopolysaccharide transport system ATP-binding protein
MSRPIIEVHGLSKRYRLGAIGATSLREEFHRYIDRWRGIERSNEKEFWALRDVSFEVQPGEVVGVIGHNGAGKSTLLKILSRITEPTSGTARMRGRVASLLEVGTGFHPELTGRENIFLNGAILGMTRGEVRAKLDEIVAFAEVEKFIDTPVKRYSSGMYVRLAFAVAAHLEPEILIIDEVLAVGDVQFQQKCLGKMQEVASGDGRTILFVSHSMQAVAALCSRGLLFRNGAIVAVGAPAEIVSQYLDSIETRHASHEWSGTAGDANITVTSARLVGARRGAFRTDEPIVIEIQATVLRPIAGLVVAIEVWSTHEQLLAYSGYDDNQPPPAPTVTAGFFARRVTIPPNTFAAGAYEIRLDVGIHNVRRIIPENAIRLRATLENTSGLGRRFQSGQWTHVARPAWQWETFG